MDIDSQTSPEDQELPQSQLVTETSNQGKTDEEEVTDELDSGSSLANDPEASKEVSQEEALAARHRKKQRRRYACYVIACLFFAAAVASSILACLTLWEIRELYRDLDMKPPRGRTLRRLIGFLSSPVTTVFGALGAKLWYTGHRLGKRDARLVLQQSDQEYVLYLRSFADDESLQSQFGIGLSSRGEFRFTRVKTEEQLCRELERAVGPVVAIGRPGETLPELGAHRLYVDQEDWQSEVLTLAERAKLIVIRVGDSKGLHWELAQMLQSPFADKLILYSENRKLPPVFRERISSLGMTHMPRRKFLYLDNDGKEICGDNQIEEAVQAMKSLVPTPGNMPANLRAKRSSSGFFGASESI